MVDPSVNELVEADDVVPAALQPDELALEWGLRQNPTAGDSRSRPIAWYIRIAVPAGSRRQVSPSTVSRTPRL
jgi:hypothetical protein